MSFFFCLKILLLTNGFYPYDIRFSFIFATFLHKLSNKVFIYLRPSFGMIRKVCFENFYEKVSEASVGDIIVKGYDYLCTLLFFDF